MGSFGGVEWCVSVASRRHQGGDLEEVVGEDAVSGPDLRAFCAVDSAAVPPVAAFDGADPSAAAGSPFEVRRSAFRFSSACPSGTRPDTRSRVWATIWRGCLKVGEIIDRAIQATGHHGRPTPARLRPRNPSSGTHPAIQQFRQL